MSAAPVKSLYGRNFAGSQMVTVEGIRWSWAGLFTHNPMQAAAPGRGCREEGKICQLLIRPWTHKGIETWALSKATASGHASIWARLAVGNPEDLMAWAAENLADDMPSGAQ